MSKFRTKARAVDLLGEQAIKDEATAIFELFKNAHDADADDAEIQVNTHTNSLVLWDNGSGMSREDVETKWLTLGTDSKHTGPEAHARTTPKGRPVMGEKGVGRLAVAMLGTQLLLVTKQHDTAYTVVYIHWDIFSNSRMFLDDAVIPVTSITAPNELVNVLSQLKIEQRQNIVSDDGAILASWAGEYEQRANKILADIAAFTVDWASLETYLDEIETSGTLFYLAGLKENWAALASVADSKSKGVRLQRKLGSLQRAMSSFTNTIELFEREKPYRTTARPFVSISSPASPAAIVPPPFTATLRVNSELIANPQVFEKGDLERYDYALVGTILEGAFQGEALVQGRLLPDPVNVEVSKGIDIMEGTDCGPLKIRLYFVEGLPKHSMLPKGDWDKITEKLSLIGGIYVYRDGLRVLPYGTADFDFLEVERRRTLSLKRYMFSLRRMFGYVALSKADNPLLQDKSSREGLRENPQYDYFRQVLMNLLDWWGQTYLQAEGRLDEHRQAAQSEQNLQAAEAAAKKRATAKLTYLVSVRRALDTAKRQVSQSAEELRSKLGVRLPSVGRIQTQISLWPKDSPQTYFTLLDALQSVDERKQTLQDEIDHLSALAALPYDERFVQSRVAVQYFEDCSTFLRTTIEELRDDLESAWRVVHEYLKEQLRVCLEGLSHHLTPGLSTENFLAELSSAVSNSDEQVRNAKHDWLRLLDSTMHNRAAHYSEKVDALTGQVSAKRSDVTTEWEPKVVAAFAAPSSKLNDVRQALEGLNQAATHEDFRATLHFIDGGLKAVGEELSAARERADKLVQQALAQFRVATVDVLDYAQHAADDRKLVSLLEKQNEDLSAELELYRAVASTGIAAEIVDHEFNQNYGRIHDILTGPKVTRLTVDSPELRQLTSLFQHLENRHRMLSPLYRNNRMAKTEIFLRTLADEVKAHFFFTSFALNHVRFDNQIPDSFTVRENRAILYPLFINLFHNSVYWMMNRRERVIEVRTLGNSLYVEDSGTGIDPERAEKVFDLFYTSREGGRGIGLHLVRDLLRARGHGIVCVTNPKEKQLPGACFRIDFVPTTPEEGAQ